MTKDQQLIRIKDEYREVHDNAAATLRTMLEWGIETGRYKLDMAKAMARAVDEFSDALSGEMATDAHGNEVRVNLAFLAPLQGWLWDERLTISHKNMELNAQYRWRMAYSDIRASVLSVNDFNERHPEETPVQFSLDFAGALADDGIRAPSSIAPEKRAVPLRSVPADSCELPKPFSPVRPRRQREHSSPADAPLPVHP